jgi:hypothetical protein
MISEKLPPVKPGERVFALSGDPRLDAFADWISAHDRRDVRAGLEATRQLRALGVSVCPVAVAGKGVAR